MTFTFWHIVFFSLFLLQQFLQQFPAGFSGRLHDGHRRRASARQRSEASNAPGGLKAHHITGLKRPRHGGNWKKRCNTFWMLEILFLSISLPCLLVFIVCHGLVLQLFSLCCSFRLWVHLISCRSTGLFHSIWIVQEIENRLKKFEVSWLCKQHRLARVPMSCRIMVLVVCPCNCWLSILFCVVWSAPCRQGHVSSSQDQHRKRWSSCTQAQVAQGQRTEGIVRVVCRILSCVCFCRWKSCRVGHKNRYDDFCVAPRCSKQFDHQKNNILLCCCWQWMWLDIPWHVVDTLVQVKATSTSRPLFSGSQWDPKTAQIKNWSN